MYSSVWTKGTVQMKQKDVSSGMEQEDMRLGTTKEENSKRIDNT